MKTLTQPTLLALALLLPACGDVGGSAADTGTSGPEAWSTEDASTEDAASDDDAAASETSDVVDQDGGPWLPPPDLTEALGEGQARAGIIVDADSLLGGPKSEGRIGDIKLYNGRSAWVLAGERRASGYSYWGGNVRDVALFGDDGLTRSDSFGELFFGWNMDVFHPSSVEVLDDGIASGIARVRLQGKTDDFHFVDSFITQFTGALDPFLDVTYDYTLPAGSATLRLDVTLTNPAGVPVELEWPLAMATFGDGVWQWAPGGGFSDSSVGSRVPYYGAVGRELGYAVVAERDDLTSFFAYSGVAIVLMDPFQVPPGSSETLTFYFVASDNGSDGLDAGRREALALPAAAPISGTVELPNGASHEDAWVVARRASGNDIVATVPVSEGGTFRMSLDAGESYSLRAWVRQHAAGEPAVLFVSEEGANDVSLAVPQCARVTVSVLDGDSASPLPARVTFIRLDGTPSAYPPSDARPAQKTWSGSISAVAYVTGDDEDVRLPAGTYQVTASRGLTYEIEQRTITLEAGTNDPEDFTITRAIDTTGWLSADFHIHGWWSPDSYVPWDIRARQAATEGLDLPILTEHVYLGDTTDEIDAVGVHDHVVPIVAQEVTTFAFGHFNAFPLVWDASKPNRGAVFPYDKDPHELFQAIRDQHAGDEIIQVNHPRGVGPGSYFTYVGLDAAEDTQKKPEEWSTNWDAIEVFNGGCGGGEPVDDWIGLTNHGYGKVLASGSDSHSESGLIGTPRNWIRIEPADVRADSQNLVPVVRDRNLFVSCGPFVRFEATGTDGVSSGLGSLVAGDGGDVTLSVSVEAPSWMLIDQVRLWENGLVVDVIDVTTAPDPVIRLVHDWSVAPAADAWYSVEVVGHGSMAPITFDGPPYALTNPIEVDADGDGEWTPPGA